MKHISLFSGQGGFDLAAQWKGWENVAHCEINPFCLQILKYYWPNAISYNDIKTTDFSIHRGTIDILTGGFPCQPYSQAGKRKGKEDERHLWPEMLRAIREIQPTWVVGENVRGLINWNGGLVFDEVQTDLETAGYEIFPFLLPAAGVNAPHERYRIWFVAYAGSNGHQCRGSFQDRSAEISRESERIQRERIRYDVERNGGTRIITNTICERLQEPECQNISGTGRRIKGRAVSELFSRPDWDNFPTEHPICSGNDGLPYKLDGITFSKWRNESIKSAGNAVVPQLVFEIFNAIEAYNS